MTHKGEHCTVFLSDLERLAHETARDILNKPHMSKEELTGLLHHQFVRAQYMKEGILVEHNLGLLEDKKDWLEIKKKYQSKGESNE